MGSRLYVHRTQSLESLLQELWMLRPELKDKPSMTVYMGTAALIREAKQTAAVMHTNLAKMTQPAMSDAYIAVKSDSSALAAEPNADESHPDEQWD